MSELRTGKTDRVQGVDGWLGSTVQGHDDDCSYAVSASCAVGIPCEHGRDVCPICDPCTCKSTGDNK